MKPVRWPHSLRTEGRRQWPVLLLAAVLGAGLTVELFAPDTRELEALEADVAQLQARLQPLPEVTSGKALHDTQALPDLPELNEAVMVWPWMQQRLQAQGLQVQALQPQSMVTVQRLPEQAVRLRLSGRWRDWLTFEQAIDTHAPWWVIDQWQVVPAGTQSGDVRIELQARLGLRPLALQPERVGPRVWPVWPVAADVADAGLTLFGLPTVQPMAPAIQAMASQTLAGLSADLRQGSVHAVRLLGIWRQAGAAYAVLGHGLDHVAVRAGQQVGSEGYRVIAVRDSEVVLQAPGADGAVLHLGIQGGKP